MIFQYGRVVLEESEKPGFKDSSFRATLKSQYLLKMELYDSLWRVSDQNFGHDRQICDGHQVRFGRPSSRQIAIFGGSTSFGWGIARESETLHGKLSELFDCTVRNYSHPAYSFFDWCRRSLLFKGCLQMADTNIFVIGVNEYFLLANGKGLIFENPRSIQIKKNIGSINFAYYNAAPKWKSIFSMVKDRLRQDVSFLMKILKIKSVNKNRSSPKIDIDLTDGQMKEFLDIMEIEMEKMRQYGRCIFVWENTIFDKNEWSIADSEIINSCSLTLERWREFKRIARIKFGGDMSQIFVPTPPDSALYFDYCHPDVASTRLLAETIFKEHQE